MRKVHKGTDHVGGVGEVELGVGESDSLRERRGAGGARVVGAEGVGAASVGAARVGAATDVEMGADVGVGTSATVGVALGPAASR